MNLQDTAKLLTEKGHPKAIVPFLAHCLDVNNLDALLAVRLLYEDDYGGSTFNGELKAPAAYCLPNWLELGLQVFVDVVVTNPTSKNVSLALQVLSGIATGEPPAVIGIHTQRDLEERVCATVVKWETSRSVATRLLNEVVLSLPSDDEVASRVGSVLQAERAHPTPKG